MGMDEERIIRRQACYQQHHDSQPRQRMAEAQRWAPPKQENNEKQQKKRQRLEDDNPENPEPAPVEMSEEKLIEAAHQKRLSRQGNSLMDKGIRPFVMVLEESKAQVNAIAYFWCQGETNMDIKVDQEINAIHCTITQKPPRREDYREMFMNHAVKAQGHQTELFKKALIGLNWLRVHRPQPAVVNEYSVQIPKEYHTVGYLEFNTKRYQGFLFFKRERVHTTERTCSSLSRDEADLDLDSITTNQLIPF
eukprot:1392071-Amorphochlora_amoeboformis.AAC.1